MINYTIGNMLDSNAEALVNTVNTVGVMGKGIALQFKKRYPNNLKMYTKACKDGTFDTGQMLIVEDGDLMNRKLIINFPTKKHWRSPSKYEYIETGLAALTKEIIERKIKSIAIPPLGCGNGGLDWNEVRAMMERHLSDLDCDITIYEPNAQIKQVLQKENEKKTAKLTPARAMLLHLMFVYEDLGEQSSLFSANKLAYFLQEMGVPMKLKFTAHHYGPYAPQVNHVLLYMNGVYLKGLEQNVAKAFEPLTLAYDRYADVKNFLDLSLTEDQNLRLAKVARLISGFESSYSLELLATVHFISQNLQTVKLDTVKHALAEWSIRKANLFEDRDIEIALKHLRTHNV
jgi:O-acetyl-ADP-ribose deacetylase (regulator of RNase III)